MTRDLLARDVMCREIVTVPEDMDVWDLARLFTERGITGAPVLDRSGKLAGVVSQTDIVRHLKQITESSPPGQDFYLEAENEGSPARRTLTARDLMNPKVIQAPEETPVRDLCQILLRHGIHRIIITRQGRLRGIVTTLDLLKVI